MLIMKIKVNCYCGYRGEETPKIILAGTRKIEVRKVLDRCLLRITDILKFLAMIMEYILSAMIRKNGNGNLPSLAKQMTSR